MVSKVSAINDSIQKTNTWLKELTAIGNFTDETQAYSALRAVLHSLRDRLPAGEAAQLAAQFPMIIRGFYFEGWKPMGQPHKEKNREEFYQCVENNLRTAAQKMDTAMAVSAVFSLLRQKISQGEIADLRASLPEDIRSLLEESPEEEISSRTFF